MVVLRPSSKHPIDTKERKDMGLLKTETSQPRFVEYTVLRTPTTARTAAAAVTRVHGREVNVTTNRVHSYLKLSQKLC